MKTQTVALREATGRILASTIHRSCGKHSLEKGHRLSKEDVHLLETESLEHISVIALEDGEVSEDEAVRMVSSEIGQGAVEMRLAAEGRADLIATEACCVLLDDGLLKQINCCSGIAIATVPNFSYVKARQRIVTVKSSPFVVLKSHLDVIISILAERGAIVQARPIRDPVIGVLYSDAINGDRARQLFEGILCQRLQRFGLAPAVSLTALEEELNVCLSLQTLLNSNPTAILVASTSFSAGAEDVIVRAMVGVGCHIERFLAPVEPGNLFLFGYRDDVTIITAPGCFHSATPNILDLVLPPMLARYKVSGLEIACLGHGGLLV